MKADLFEKILDRTETKIINKVYCWQQASSDPEDECQSIEQDLKAISLNITEENVKNVYNFDYKKLVKTIARNAAFIQLEFLKESHEGWTKSIWWSVLSTRFCYWWNNYKHTVPYFVLIEKPLSEGWKKIYILRKFFHKLLCVRYVGGFVILNNICFL